MLSAALFNDYADPMIDTGISVKCPLSGGLMRLNIVFEPHTQKYVFFMSPIHSIILKPPVTTVEDTGTFSNYLRHSTRDFVGAAFNSRNGSNNVSRWSCVNLELVAKILK